MYELHWMEIHFCFGERKQVQRKLICGRAYQSNENYSQVFTFINKRRKSYSLKLNCKYKFLTLKYFLNYRIDSKADCELFIRIKVSIQGLFSKDKAQYSLIQIQHLYIKEHARQFNLIPIILLQFIEDLIY
jgi:hypothetical protein